MITVPDVFGASVAAAEKQITDLGLKYEIKEEYSTSDAGTVYNQLPASGAELKKGSTVTLFVSKGPEPTPTPTPTNTPTPTFTPTPSPTQESGGNTTDSDGNKQDTGN